MTLKLNQVIAQEKDAKAQAASSIDSAYHTLQKPVLFAGQERVYQSKDEEGDQFPAEPVRLQNHVFDVLQDMIPAVFKFWNLTVTKDAGNQTATADIVVDGQVLVPNVPVTSLLFLEKQLADLSTVISKLPVLDAAETWSKVDGAYRSETVHTTKTKKLPVVVTKAPATDKHPAQTDVFQEDKVIGTWSTTKLSGAIPSTQRASLLARVQTLRTAVKVAREEANTTQVQERKIAAALFGYLAWADTE